MRNALTSLRGVRIFTNICVEYISILSDFTGIWGKIFVFMFFQHFHNIWMFMWFASINWKSFIFILCLKLNIDFCKSVFFSKTKKHISDKHFNFKFVFTTLQLGNGRAGEFLYFLVKQVLKNNGWLLQYDWSNDI